MFTARTRARMQAPAHQRKQGGKEAHHATTHCSRMSMILQLQMHESGCGPPIGDDSIIQGGPKSKPPPNHQCLK